MKRYEEIMVSLRRVIRAIDLHSKKLNKETGLTGPQLIVMQQVSAFDSITVKNIADNINLSSATVTSILDRLEKRGLLTRERSTQDRRKVSLHLTSAGEDILSEAPQPLQEFFISRFESLDEWEQNQLVATMQRIAKMMDADSIDAAPLLEVEMISQPSEQSSAM